MFDDNFNVNFDLSSFEKPESKPVVPTPVVPTPALTDPCEDKIHSNSIFSNYKDCSKQNDSVIEIMDSEVCFDISSDQSGDVAEVIMDDQLKTNLSSFPGDKYATEGHTTTFQLTSFQGNETDGSPLLKK
uniref:Uncharacterized protein n=1 Tax=Ciona savignyi TaxID=51511 RepID=H2Z358_CIOSA